MHNDPWYLDAVIYAVDVKRFADSDGDGVGDFKGLCDKLPYIAGLGVTCLWLLPFFRSPGRDNGYDISDYFSIDPRLGTTSDFLTFLHLAGEYGIRVVMDLVINHTSDEHPWFEAARRDEQSRYRNYYVWSADPPPVKGGDQSVFPDAEPTVWTYDETARAYFYHKFYRFQPDLNTSNPAVLDEIERIMDYWLSLGVSGFRLDAIPFVIGQNGLKQADPADPAGVMERLNSFVQNRRPGGVLLGEVNLPPAETGRYFGDGDQLGLLFNFMTPCYVFAAMAEEKAERIEQALTLLAEPPPDCGWANFLRNLDELDFSQVPTEIKDAAFRAYARNNDVVVHDRGIRRRLAPMLGGDPDRIAMALSLLLSLPGAPVLIYGDEIGMGDDLSQPDRQSVRIPMQWAAKRHGGFTTAAPSAHIQPVVSEGPFSFKAVNVADQSTDKNSLLCRVKRLIMLRREIAPLLRGRSVPVRVGADAIFARASGNGVETVLTLHNLAGREQKIEVEIDMGQRTEFVNLFSGDRLRMTARFCVTLPAYGYCWFKGCAERSE
jgi:maltose alpha-D-glucosyltransferase/alpha-amylase